MILIIIACTSCNHRMVERKLSTNSGNYSIKYPGNWNFFDYGFDGDSYEDPYLMPNATLIYGKNLDAKVVIFFLKKSSKDRCNLGKVSPYDYNETKADELQKDRMITINESLSKWKKDSQTNTIRIYFTASDSECVLFELSKNNKLNHRAFYKIINSFH